MGCMCFKATYNPYLEVFKLYPVKMGEILGLEVIYCLLYREAFNNKHINIGRNKSCYVT